MQARPEGADARGTDPLLEAALGSMPYGFSIWDEHQRLVLFNRRYLDMYGFDETSVRIGMTLKEICVVTCALGNHPGFTPEELYATYAQRLRAANEPDRIIRAQKHTRGRIIKTSHVKAPGLGWVVTHEDVTEEVAAAAQAQERDEAIRQQNARFAAAVNAMAHGLSLYDADWKLVTCNQRYLDIYGLTAEQARPGTPFQEIIAQRKERGAVPVDFDGDFAEHVLRTTDPTRRRVQTYRLGTGRVVQITQSPVEGGGFVAIHQDITEDIERLDRLETGRREIAQQNLRFDAAVNNISQGLCMFDRDERLVVCNRAYAGIYNLPTELMAPGTTLSQILEYRFAHGMVPVGGRDNYVHGRKALVTNRVIAKDVIEMEDGRTIAINHFPMTDGGWVATHEDITEQRRNEARIQHLARHDALTDLPNRLLLREVMDKAETRIRRGEMAAVLCVDLDHFKAVNDTLGHAVGDGVLTTVAGRLREACRESDIVARLGGDEFAILVGGLESATDAAAVAARIVKSIGDPMLIDGRQAMVGASVGIAVAPTDGTDADTLLKNADLALYRAKSEGRGNFHFFERGMDQALQERRTLEQGLKVALAGRQFRLVYQPLLSLEEHRISCLEALLRWDHPERGVVSPGEFIPIAEDSGLIIAIGEWVLREACRAAARWPEHVRVAVNLSPVQFKNRALVNQVTSALHEAGLDPSRLELEITESLLLANTDMTLETLHRLRAIGVRIAMDDFGTGYSSLSYLRSFPFDKIKIDRSFMTGLSDKQDNLAIIKAVIGLGRSLGMATTAEGIETEDQFAAVRAEGCSEVQGFLFSPPLPESGVDALLGVADKGEALRRKA